MKECEEEGSNFFKMNLSQSSGVTVSSPMNRSTTSSPVGATAFPASSTCGSSICGTSPDNTNLLGGGSSGNGGPGSSRTGAARPFGTPTGQIMVASGLSSATFSAAGMVDKKLFKRNDKGETQLHLAAKKGDIKLVKRLIKAGAEVNAQDNAGWTPLHESTIRNFVDVTKVLLRYGAAANLRGLHGETALHDAAANGHERILKCLLRHGADPLQCNDAGRTPLDVARDPSIVELFTAGASAATSGGSVAGCGGSCATPVKRLVKMQNSVAAAAGCSGIGVGALQTAADWPHQELDPATSPGCSSGTESHPERQSPRLTIRLPTSNSAAESSHHGFTPTAAAAGTSLSCLLTPPTAPAITKTPPTAPAIIEETAATTSSSSGNHNYYMMIPSRHQQEVQQQAQPSGSQSSHLLLLGGTVSSFEEAASVSGSCSSTQSCASERLRFFQHREPAQTVATVTTASCSALDETVVQNHYSSSLKDPYAFEEDSPPSTASMPVSVELIKPDSLKEAATLANAESNLTHEDSSIFEADPLNAHIEVDDSIDTSNAINAEIMRVPPLRIRIPQQEKQTSEQSIADATEAVAATVSNAVVTTQHVECTNSCVTQEVAENFQENLVLCPSNISAVSTPISFSMAAETVSLKASVCASNSLTSQSVNEASSTSTSLALQHLISKGNGNSLGGCGSGSDSAPESSGSGSGGVAVGERRSTRAGRTLRSHTAAQRERRGKSGDNNNDPSSINNSCETLTESTSTSVVVDQTIEPENCRDQQLNTSYSTSSTETLIKQPQNPDFNNTVSSSSVRPPPKKRRLRTRGAESTSGENSVNAAAADFETISSASALPSASQQPMQLIVAKVPKLEIPENPVDKLQAVKKLLAERLRRLVPVQPKAPKGYQDYLLVTGKYLLSECPAGTVVTTNGSARVAPPERYAPPPALHQSLLDLFNRQEEERQRLRLAHRAERDKLCLSLEQEIVREHTNAALAMASQSRAFSFCAFIADRDFTHLPGDFVDTKDGTNSSAGSALSSSAAGVTAPEPRCRQLSRHFITCVNDILEKYDKLKSGQLCRQHHEADSLQAVQRLDWELLMKRLHLCERRDLSSSQSQMPSGARISRACVPPVLVPADFSTLPQKPI